MSMVWSFCLGLLSLVMMGAAIGQSDMDKLCPQPSVANPMPPFKLLAHPYDCARFYSCVFGNAKGLACPSTLVFSQASSRCEWPPEDVTFCVPSLSVQEIIELTDPTLILPHPTICQRYFNLSDTSPRWHRSFLEVFESECPYPDLFDVVDKKCKDFRVARCGGRAEGKSPCDYVQNLCPSSHCEPCSSAYGSCIGKEDGFQAHQGRPESPHYIECKKERTIRYLYCEGGIFSAEIRECVPFKDYYADKAP